MEVVPRKSLAREEISVADLKPYLKLRLGGSRSTVALGKFLRDAMQNPPTRFDSSKSSHESTRSLDSQSVSSRSTDSSVKPKKVRIVGRGGAGARLRNYSKDAKKAGPTPAPIVDMDLLHAPEATVIRTVGRGGLGSRPQTSRGKSKAESRSRDPSFELRDMRRSLSSDGKVRSESSRHSAVSSISSIHFAGETGLPAPDFFKVTKKRYQKRPLDTHNERDEAFDLERTLSPQPSRSTSDATSSTESRSSLDSKAKAKRRERRFSLLFSIFQNDVTRESDSTASPLSMSNLPSQLTLTSIETDPSYFFHGPGSPPRRGRETDSTTGSSYSAMEGSSLFSFQREFSPSPLPDSRQEDIDETNDEEIEECHALEINECNDEEMYEPSSPQPDQRIHSSTNPRNGVSFTSHTLGMHLSPSEADALGRYPARHGPPDDGKAFIPSMPRTENSISTKRRSAKSESWTGEWNAGMVDVIRALRELR